METVPAARGRRSRDRRSLRELTPRPKRSVDPADKAFETFYQEHVAEVYQYALAVLTNPADAEDVTQATFLNAYRAFKRGERPRIAHNWLIKIAHNVCRMRWRQARRRPQEVPFEEFHEPVVVDDEKPSVDDVLRALSVLPFNQRAALVMREVEGRNYGEIAEILGTTLPAVEALLFRARQKLRMRRKAIGVLSTAPVPASLSSFFGGGSVVGGSVLASSVALKAAAVVATGIVAGSLGFKAAAIADPGQQELAPVFRAGPALLWADPAGSVIRAKQSRNAAARERGGRVATRRGGRPVKDGTAIQRVPLAPGHGFSVSPSPTSTRSPITTVSSSLPVQLPVPVPTPSTPKLPQPPALPVAVPVVTVPTVTIPPLPK